MVSVILPSLNPDEKLLLVVNGLIEVGFSRIIIIDDGSDDAHQQPFLDAKSLKECIVLRHAENFGKGRALKTGFTYFLENDKTSIGVVTVDGDGQHLPKDVWKCACALEENPKEVILGVRDFSGKDIPFRSRFGNRMTSFVFQSACGLLVSDTQTGLRAIAREHLNAFLGLSGDRFEFETNMLLELRPLQIKSREITIETLYEEENRRSHFNPLKDSLRIYRLLFKFLTASIVGFLIDIILFSVIYYMLPSLQLRQRILVATVVSRIVSSFVNYMINRIIVFVKTDELKSSMIKYYLLSIVQMLLSYGGVYTLVRALNGFATPSKLVIDCILFVISFQIQRDWVFQKKEAH